MKFYLSEMEYDLLVELSFFNGLFIEITKCVHVVYIVPTGTQVREMVKRLFDFLWSDLLSAEEKRVLSFLGWRLTDKCL